jgi:hypothetical protein
MLGIEDERRDDAGLSHHERMIKKLLIIDRGILGRDIKIL